jgi:hypothetical protein
MLQTKVVQKIKTHFMFNNFFFENRAVYEIIWKRFVGWDRQQTTIQNGACLACCISKVTDTLRYIILIAFPRQQWLQERASMLRYTYTVRLVNYKLKKHSNDMM